MKSVQVEDHLGRELIEVDTEEIFRSIKGKTVLVIVGGEPGAPGGNLRLGRRDLRAGHGGEPVKIDTLARNLVRFFGHKPDGDIKIVYSGFEARGEAV